MNQGLPCPNKGFCKNKALRREIFSAGVGYCFLLAQQFWLGYNAYLLYVTLSVVKMLAKTTRKRKKGNIKP